MGLNIGGVASASAAARRQSERVALAAAMRRIEADVAELHEIAQAERQRKWATEARPRLLARQQTYAGELKAAGAVVQLAELPDRAPDWFSPVVPTSAVLPAVVNLEALRDPRTADEASRSDAASGSATTIDARDLLGSAR